MESDSHRIYESANLQFKHCEEYARISAFRRALESLQRSDDHPRSDPLEALALALQTKLIQEDQINALNVIKALGVVFNVWLTSEKSENEIVHKGEYAVGHHLDTAIILFRQALQLGQSTATERTKSISDLIDSLFSRFLHTHQLRDLDEVMSIWQDIDRLTFESSRSLLFSTATAALSTRVHLMVRK